MNPDVYWMIIDLLAATTFLLFAGGAVLLFMGKSATVALFNEWIGTSTAITMARSSAMEYRIGAILDASRRTGQLSAAAAIAMLFMAIAIVAPAAALRGQASPTKTSPSAPEAGGKRVRYSGRTVTEDGKPLTGVEVFLVGRLKASGPDTELATARSAADGSFTMDAPAPRYEAEYRTLQACHDGCALASARPEPGTACDLQLAAATSARVQFLDPRGQPVKNLRVVPLSTSIHENWFGYKGRWAARFTRTTDAQGICVFDMLPFASKTRIAIYDDRFADLKRTEDIPTTVIPQKTPFVIHLRPAAVITGKVTFAGTGAPAVGFHMHAVSRRNGASGIGAGVPVLTNERGEYRMPRVNEGTHVIHLLPRSDDEEDIGWTAASLVDVHVAAGANVTDQNLVLVKGTVVRGRVYETDTNKPFAGAIVDALEVASDEFPGGQRTDADGRFAIRVPPGRIKIRLSSFPPDGYSSPAFDTGGPPLEITAVDGVDQTIDMKLFPKPGREISGKVVDADGKPVAGAMVRVSDNSPRGRPGVRTDADGRFSLGAIQKGATLSVSAGDAGTLEPVAIPDPPASQPLGPPRNPNGDGAELVIHLARNVVTKVSGSIIDSSEKPVANAAIYILVIRDHMGTVFGGPHAYTDSAGRFTFETCAGMQYRLIVKTNSYQQKQVPVEFTPGEEHHEMERIVLYPNPVILR